MKRFIPIIFFFMLTASIVKAQTGNVTITATLTDVIDITVVTPAAAITMNTASHYQDGTSNQYIGAITVSTNQAWDLSVKASSANFTSGANNIAVSEFNVAVTGEADGTNNGILNLTTSDQILIDASSGTVLTTLDVTYGADGGSAFIGTPAGAYLNTYTFTVTAD